MQDREPVEPNPKRPGLPSDGPSSLSAGRLSAAREQLSKRLSAARRRIALRAWLSALPKAVGRFLPLLGLLVGTLLALGHAELGRAVFGVGIVLLLFNLGALYRPRATRLSAAIELDRVMGETSAFAPAFAFSTQAEAELGPYERWVVESEGEKVRGVELGRLLPVRVGLGPTLSFLGVGLIALLFALPWHSRAVVPASPSPKPVEAARVLYAVDDLRLRLDSQSAELHSEPAVAVRNEALALLDGLSKGEASADEALLRLKDLEASLERSQDDARGLVKRLAEKGEALKRSALSRRAGEALERHRLEDAQEALAELEERLAQGTSKLPASELEKLRQALTRAAEERSERAQAESASSSDPELEKSLESRKRDLAERASSGPLTPAERAERAEVDRRLATLNRRRKAEAESQKAESELDRKLAEAARALSEETRREGEKGGANRKRAQRYVDGAREQLRELEKKSLTDAEKELLLRELTKMKERLREGGPAAEEARASLRAFEERARRVPRAGSGSGERSESGEPSGAPAGSATEASGSETSGSEGAKLGDSGKRGPSELGPAGRPGSLHDPNLTQAEAGGPEMSAALDVAALAQDLPGESEAEVFERAARRGFASPNYRRLYLEYRAIEEEVLARDHVPPGYASRVLRYFDLIEPSAPASPGH
jgi:hypothetical protein